ncbi:hypothetical protein HPB50_020284 [Hyalomma asiaticum]|uniref:Uncharacterized protein n=1 Tax=Hyalomma asiaticum TaxID=266040 RepID=A0ACB7T0K2_HYAAI|nr:hypothetical protein HPB50_020284 [Hyalomma asiaticum]
MPGYTVMWAGQDPRSDRSTIGIVVIVCRVPPTNHIPWCHRGKTNPNMWSKVEGLVMCVMHRGATIAVSVDMWLASALSVDSHNHGIISIHRVP